MPNNTPKKPKAKGQAANQKKPTYRKAPNNKKKNVKKGKTTSKDNQKRFFGSKARRVFLTTLVVAGVAAFYHHMTDNKVTIAKVVDIEGDAFEGTIPVYGEDGTLIAEIGNDSVVITESTIPKDDEKRVYVSAIDSNGENIVGQTEGKYLEKIKKISQRKIEEYDTLYTVLPDSGVNVRDSAKVSGKNKIGAIECGEQVLGSTKLVVEDNDFLWVPVLYTDGEEILEGYIRSDLLKEHGTFDDLYIISEKEAEKDGEEEKRTKMLVDTSKESSVNLKLRSETVRNPENIIAEIPDGSVVYAIGDDVTSNDAIDWRRVEYTDKDGNVHTGWVSNAFLREYNEIEKVVDTSKDGKVNLKVRKEPGTSSEKIAEIQHGTTIKIPEADIEARQTVDDREWVKVTLSDGTTRICCI